MEESISVLPRIIDPDMKFTVDSIKGMPTKKSSSINVKKNNDSNNKSDTISESGSTTCTNSESSKIGIFWSNYKYIILTIVIIILVCIIVYLIYRYFKKNTTKKIENITNEQKSDEKISEDTKQKINEYVSNYIIDEDDETELNEEDETDLNKYELNKEDLNKDELNKSNESKDESNDLLVETEQNIIHTALPQQFNLVIQENIKVDPKLNHNSNRFEELYETVESNLELNEINNINENREDIIDSSNLDNELDNLILNTKKNLDYEINSDKQSETNESLDLNNIIDEIEPSEDNKPDENINYFKKFIKNSQ